MRKVLFLLPLLLLYCTPKSPNLTEREKTLINSQDILQWAEDVRVEILTSVRTMREAGEISAATVEKFRELGKRMETVQRTAVEAQRSYILITSEQNESKFVEALEQVKRMIIEIQRLWQETKGGE